MPASKGTVEVTADPAVPRAPGARVARTRGPGRGLRPPAVAALCRRRTSSAEQYYGRYCAWLATAAPDTLHGGTAHRCSLPGSAERRRRRRARAHRRARSPRDRAVVVPTSAYARGLPRPARLASMGSSSARLHPLILAATAGSGVGSSFSAKIAAFCPSSACRSSQCGGRRPPSGSAPRWTPRARGRRGAREAHRDRCRTAASGRCAEPRAGSSDRRRGTSMTRVLVQIRPEPCRAGGRRHRLRRAWRGRYARWASKSTSPVTSLPTSARTTSSIFNTEIIEPTFRHALRARACGLPIVPSRRCSWRGEGSERRRSRAPT